MQRFIRDLNLQRCLTSYLPVESRILWTPACGNGHSSCLEMMDAGETRHLRRVARRRRIGCVCPGGPCRDVALRGKEISQPFIKLSYPSLLDHHDVEQAIAEARRVNGNLPSTTEERGIDNRDLDGTTTQCRGGLDGSGRCSRWSL